MTTTTALPTRPLTRIILRWLATFPGFPLGGLAAMLVVGPVESRSSALLGGLLSGAVLGLVQGWGLALDRRAALAWAAVTSLGFGAGLAVGAGLVDHATDLSSLVIQGAATGLAVGTAQAFLLVAPPGLAGRRLARLPGGDLGAGLDAHHRGRRPRRRPVHRLRRRRRRHRHRPHLGATARPRPPDPLTPAPGRNHRHEPTRRVRDRPGRPPPRHPPRRRRPRRRRRQPRRSRPLRRRPRRRWRRQRPGVHPRGMRRRDRRLLLSQRTPLRALGRGVPATAARGARRCRGGGGAARRAGQPLHLRRPARQAPGRDDVGQPHVDEVRDPRRHDRGAPRRPPCRAGRGRHRPRVGLLRTRGDALSARRERVRARPARQDGPGDGRPRPTPQLLVHARRRRRPGRARHRRRCDRRGLAPPRRPGTFDPRPGGTDLRTRPETGRGCWPPEP